MAPFIREVWNWNLRPELAILEHALQSFPILSVDCEFPGFLLQTPRNATDDLRYKDLKHNVDQTHIIQLGVTLSDLHRGGVFDTWQFNFEFDLDKDVHTKETVTFLRGHGIDFESHRADGIKKTRFAAEFISLMARRTSPLIWSPSMACMILPTSSSLLTALVFSNMRRRFQVHQHLFADVLYGISEKIERRTPTFKAAHYSSQQLLCQPMPVVLVPCYRPYLPPAQCQLLPLHTPFRMGQY
ncbi:Probable CCR4-associated factor 1 homolog 5 [Linum grandiflorum]